MPRTDPDLSASRPAHKDPFWIAALLIAILPRALRMLGPMAWFEDAGALYHAWVIGQGETPFVDGIYSHPPLIEYLLAGLHQVFGHGYRVAEAFSAIVVIAMSLLLFDMAKRLCGARYALAGLILFSAAPLFWRYHIFEREVFTAAAGTAGLWLLVRYPQRRGAALAAGALAVIAAATKLTGVFLLPALAVGFWTTGGRQQGLRTLVAGVAGGLLLAGGLWLAFGRAAYFQMFLLQSIAGARPSFWTALHSVLIPHLGALLVLGPAGLVAACRHPRQEVVFAASLWGLQALLFFAVKGTLWAHNLIDLLPALALGTALGLHTLTDALRNRRPLVRTAALLLPGIAFLAMGAIKPGLYTQSWGYVRRVDFAAAAAFLRNHTPPDLPLSAPHHLAAEAGRRKLIDYRELAGPYLWMLQTLETQGFAGLKACRDFGPWLRMVHQTSALYRPAVDDAIRQGAVGAVVWDASFPEWRMHQAADQHLEQTEGLLSGNGYRPAYRQAPYVIWLPAENAAAAPSPLPRR